MGAAAKSRSSSKALSRVLKTSLGYMHGGALYPDTLHCRSQWDRADGPSRERDVEPPSRPKAPSISKLEKGDFEELDKLLEIAKWTRPVGRWIRLLLLLAGDIERNPGPLGMSYAPRDKLDMFGVVMRHYVTDASMFRSLL